MMEAEDRYDNVARQGRTSSWQAAFNLAELPTMCLVVLSSVAVVFALVQLEGVLVPLTLAAGLSQLFEPVLGAVASAPAKSCRCMQRLCCVHFCCFPCWGTLVPPLTMGSSAASGGERLLLGGAGAPPAMSAGSASAASAVNGGHWQPSLGVLHEDAASGDDELDTETGNIVEPSEMPVPRAWRIFDRIKACLQGAWDIISVGLVTLMLLSLVSAFVWIFVAAIENFDFIKYKDSKKLDELIAWLHDHGISFSGDAAYVWNNFKSTLLSVASAVLSFSEGAVLTLLMFFFCLYAMAPSAHSRVPGGRSGVKHLVQQYLLMKTLISLIIGASVGISLQLLHVDLAVVFGLLTFVMNYIPNVGAAIATLAPLPLVLLDPTKDISQAIFCVAVPFGIHNTLGCILEPKLMAHGLDLHPLTVVVALTFWGSVWGIPGAVLSVPITSVLRLGLQQADHPYAQLAASWLNSAEPAAAAVPLPRPSGRAVQFRSLGLEAPRVGRKATDERNLSASGSSGRLGAEMGLLPAFSAASAPLESA